jgi:hypothetical protein
MNKQTVWILSHNIDLYSFLLVNLFHIRFIFLIGRNFLEALKGNVTLYYSFKCNKLQQKCLCFSLWPVIVLNLYNLISPKYWQKRENENVKNNTMNIWTFEFPISECTLNKLRQGRGTERAEIIRNYQVKHDVNQVHTNFHLRKVSIILCRKNNIHITIKQFL